jgi:hypothetical protein
VNRHSFLSGGRLDFGVGKGYRHNEFAGFCLPIDEADARFNESLDVNPVQKIAPMTRKSAGCGLWQRPDPDGSGARARCSASAVAN